MSRKGVCGSGLGERWGFEIVEGVEVVEGVEDDRIVEEVEGVEGVEDDEIVEAVEVVEVISNARKFIKQVVLGCRSEFLGLGKGYAVDHYKGC